MLQTSDSVILPPWLLMAKVTAPEPPAGYVRRDSLLQRVDAVLERRLTVLQAPGGFGKTTVLADVTHRKRREGVAVAWLGLDRHDTPEVFGSYLTRAFEQAGVDLAFLGEGEPWSSAPYRQQLGMLARAIELHSEACLLVLDEVDLLPRPTAESVDLLLTRMPPHLHFAVAFRFNPGLDLASYFLDGTAVLVKAPAFRFSRPDIVQLFDRSLSRRELAAVEERTAGWPVALMVRRRQRAAGKGPPGMGVAELSENYVGVRLLRGLSSQDRASLLDLSIFDRIDAELVDDVLGSSDARLRIASLSSLEGLLLPHDEEGAVWRLHPLVRESCDRMFAAENPVRKRRLHVRAARALALRGELVPAWSHATAAGDSRLVGDLIEDVGVFGLWLREGVIGLTLAARFLTAEIVASHPRLALLRCVRLQLAAKFDEAAGLYETVGQQTDGFVRDRAGGDPEALAVDRVFTEAVLSGGTCRSLKGALDPLLAEEGIAGRPGERARTLSVIDQLTRCIGCCQRAEFEQSRHHGLQAQAQLGKGMRHGEIFASLYLGMAAMVQGRVQDAVEWYTRARQGTRHHFRGDSRLATGIDVLSMELDLERNRGKAIQQRTLQGFTELRGVWNEIYAVAIAVRAELAFDQYDSGAVIQFLGRTEADVRGLGRSLENYVSALLVQYQVKAGRADEGGQIWVDRGLPRDASALLDLKDQSWRRMEALSCARVMLLAGQGALEEARELVDALCATAWERGMTRTALRGLSLSIAVAHRAGQKERALSGLVEFLRLTRDPDYVRSLVSQGEVGRFLLRGLLDTDLDTDLRGAAEALLPHVGKPDAAASPEFTPREMDVLAEVRQGRRNKEIASALGITDGGVRYHLKNIYRKTGVSRRLDALRYAEERGVLL